MERLNEIRKYLAHLNLALEEAEYDKAKLQTELTLVRRELTELQKEMIVLKQQLSTADQASEYYKTEAIQYHNDAIKWAKAHDDIQYKYQKSIAYVMERRKGK